MLSSLLLWAMVQNENRRTPSRFTILYIQFILSNYAPTSIYCAMHAETIASLGALSNSSHAGARAHSGARART